MSIYLQLFLTFLEIGAVSFGGGYGMISLIREKILLHGWMTEEQLLNMVAVSESTPGPVAINMATFVGAAQGGLPGALCATIGVVLPSVLVILLIATLIRGFLKYRTVNAFLGGVRPCVVGMILSTALLMALKSLCGIVTVSDCFSPDLPAFLIFALLIIFSFLWKKLRKKAPSPILLIAVSAVLGLAVYGIF